MSVLYPKIPHDKNKIKLNNTSKRQWVCSMCKNDLHNACEIVSCDPKDSDCSCKNTVHSNGETQ